MRSKELWNYFIRGYSYFHRQERCLGFAEIYNLESTNICPMDCKMCPRRNMTRDLGYMKFPLFQKIIDQTKGYTEILWLDHFGDPLFNPQLKQMVSYAKSIGIETRISTNPTSLSPKKVKELMDTGLDRILLSLDGTNQETYSFLRGKNAHYGKAVDNINRLVELKLQTKKEKPFIEVSMIRMKETEAEIEEFKNRWNMQGINKILIKQFKTWDGSDAEIIKLAEEAQLSETYREPVEYPCVRPWFIITILWDGRVVPCCYDYDGKYIIGDLNSESLEEIWNNERMRKLRWQHINNNFEGNPLCAECKEKKGFPSSRFYPFDFRLLRNMKIKRIFNSIKREEESAS
jgi:radical SAM protein with 4Fe4S-binding SPASM domain